MPLFEFIPPVKKVYINPLRVNTRRLVTIFIEYAFNYHAPYYFC